MLMFLQLYLVSRSMNIINKQVINYEVSANN